MKLSTKGRYGARAMLDLALHNSDTPVMLKDIARRLDVSIRYLERIMTMLVSAGLIRSSRGQNGGFRLAESPEKIKLSQIIQVAEGSIAPVKCVDDPKTCKKCNVCITHDIWKKVHKAILGVLDSITLKDMVEMQKKKNSNPKTQMYYI